MKTWERHHVDHQLAEVSIELAKEVEAGGDTTLGGQDEVFQVPLGWHGQLEVAEADVVKGLVVDAVGLISVLHQLMDSEGGIIGLSYSVRHFE